MAVFRFGVSTLGTDTLEGSIGAGTVALAGTATWSATARASIRSAATLSSDATWSAAGLARHIVGPPPLGTIVPMYIYPTGGAANAAWQAMIANPPFAIIANPATGPGTSLNTDYQSAIAATRAAGIKVLGYVNANYGSRTLGTSSDTASSNTMYGDMNGWTTIYGSSNIDGYFFDLTPTGTGGAGDLTFVTNATNYARSHKSGAFVMHNPGTYPLAGSYIAVADTVCVFEGTWTSYSTFSVPGYTGGYERTFRAARMTHLVYQVTSLVNARSGMLTAIAANAGVYFASDDTSGLWADIPPYYAAELRGMGVGSFGEGSFGTGSFGVGGGLGPTGVTLAATATWLALPGKDMSGPVTLSGSATWNATARVAHGAAASLFVVGVWNAAARGHAYDGSAMTVTSTFSASATSGIPTVYGGATLIGSATLHYGAGTGPPSENPAVGFIPEGLLKGTVITGPPLVSASRILIGSTNSTHTMPSGFASAIAYSSNTGGSFVNDNTPFDDDRANAAIWVAPLNLWVAVGQGYHTTPYPQVATSPDGLIWTRRSTPLDATANMATSVAWNGSLLVVGCNPSSGSGTPFIMTSPNAVTWTARTTPFTAPSYITAVGWSSTLNQWLAVGGFIFNTGSALASPIAATSPDGITWTSRTLPMRATSDNQGYPVCVLWDVSLNRWYVGGSTPTSPLTALVSSPDGITWSTVTLPTGLYSVSGIAESSGGVTAVVGSTVSSSTTIATTTNGTTWTSRVTGNSWNQVVWDGARFLAVGSGSTRTLMQSDAGGLTWTVGPATPYDPSQGHCIAVAP